MKTRHIKLWFTTQTLAAVLILFALPLLSRANDITNVSVRIASTSPLADALYYLARHFGASINYETPGYYYYDNPSRLIFTNQVGNEAWLPQRVLLFDYSPTNCLLRVIERALQADRITEPDVVYGIVTNQQGYGDFSVIPQCTVKEDGTILRKKSELETPITFEAKAGEPIDDVIQRLFSMALRNSPYSDGIRIGSLFKRSSNSPIEYTFSTTNEMAISVLNRLVSRSDDDQVRFWHVSRKYFCVWKDRTIVQNFTVKKRPALNVDHYVLLWTGRPISDAIRLVQRDLKRPIGYEGEELINGGFSATRDGKPYRPVGGKVEFEYYSGWSAEQICGNMIKDVQLGPCSYEVVKTNDIVCVLPGAKERGPEKVNYQRVSVVNVDVSTDMKSVVDVLSDICSQVEKGSGKKIVLSAKTAEMKLQQVPFKATNLPCWIVLSQYAHAVSPTLSWTILYYPARERFELEVYDINSPTPDEGSVE